MKNIEGNEPFLPGFGSDEHAQIEVSEPKALDMPDPSKLPENMRTPKFEKDDDPGRYDRGLWNGTGRRKKK